MAALGQCVALLLCCLQLAAAMPFDQQGDSSIQEQDDMCANAFTGWLPWTGKAANIKTDGCGDRVRTRKVRNATLARLCNPNGWDVRQFTQACYQLSKDELRSSFQYYVVDRLFGRSAEVPDQASSRRRRNAPVDPFMSWSALNIAKSDPYNTCPEDKEYRPVDFLVMLDKSGSMRQRSFEQLRDAMAVLVEKSIPSVAAESTRLALLSFAATPDVEFDFNACRDKRCYKKIFKNSTNVRTGGPTRMSIALNKAAELFTTARGSRRCSRKVVMIVTDGTGDQDTPYAQASFLKDVKDVEVFVMAISRRIDETQLTLVASHPSFTHLYYMRSTKMFKRIFKKLDMASVPEGY